MALRAGVSEFLSTRVVLLRCQVVSRLAHQRSIVPVDPAVPIVAPPPLAVRPPERNHELEDVAGERRRGDGDLRGPRPAARVGPSGRSPGEEAQIYRWPLASPGPPRRGVRHGGRFSGISSDTRRPSHEPVQG